MIKNCSAILGDRIWPKVESSLMANVKPGLRNDFKTILANTRQSLLAENLTSNLVYLPKIVLPLVRRLFPKLIANNIISTQPMQGPSGWIRYLNK